jgi:hypothetical protein
MAPQVRIAGELVRVEQGPRLEMRLQVDEAKLATERRDPL